MTEAYENYRIKAAMHPFPHTIGLQQTLAAAKEIMHEHDIRHLPVQKGGQLEGILSERDIDFALRMDHKEPQELKVAHAYMPEPYTVELETPLSDVAAKMAQEHIGCALVTENGKLVGIFTTVDACRVLAEVLSVDLKQ